MTYRNCKKVIENGKYEKEDMLEKLDVFLMGNRITIEEYKELVSMIEVKESQKEQVQT